MMARTWPRVIPLFLILAATRADEDINYRLPITVLPSHYTIKIVTYFEEKNFTFDGEVEIAINATSDANSVTLHYADLDIVGTPTLQTLDGGDNLEVATTSYDNITNFYRLELKENLQLGREYLLQIKYTGQLKKDMVGYYRCSYNTSNNETRWLAVTQFEPTDARKAFPCFDEPALKARFQVNLARSKEYHAISNMPKENSSDPDPTIGGMIWDSFQETPPMSTYLVAFVVSDLKNLSTKDGKYGVWMREEVLSQGKYALSVAPTIINILENYTGIMYELPKLDQVAIPDLFYWAMENWGMVTLWEGQVMYKDGVSTALRKQDTLLLIAHEFAHLWFGDLVSPKWWNHLWLNEGFATYYEYMIPAKLEPSWNLDEQFNVDMFQTALSEDSLISTHPMTHNVSSPDEINAIFDIVSYDKAGSIIRSMEHFLTKDTFQKGLGKYLKANSHSNVEADDLFRILNEQQKEDRILPADMDVKTIMDSWTLQPGYPVIHVQRMHGDVSISQERFLLKRTNDIHNNATWWVPISYTKSINADFNDTRPKTWLKGEPSIELMDDVNDDEWIIINIQATGFYRVNYDPLTWSLLTKHLTSPDYEDIHVLNRAQLLDDAFSLARAGILNYTTALELSTYLIEEPHYIPWATYFGSISYIKRHLYGTDAYNDFKNYTLILLNKLYESVGFKLDKVESHMRQLMQPTVTYWACVLDHKNCVTRAIELFSNWMKQPDKNQIPPNLKDVVYCTAVRNNKKMWEFLQSQPDNELDEQENIYEALSCTEDEALLKKYLSMAIDEDTEGHELEAAIYYLTRSSSKGVDFLTMSKNLQDIFDSLKDHKDSIGRIITMIASRVTKHQQAERLKEFLDKNNLHEEAREGKWIPETMDEDIIWTERHNSVISEWLRKFVRKNMT